MLDCLDGLGAGGVARTLWGEGGAVWVEHFGGVESLVGPEGPSGTGFPGAPFPVGHGRPRNSFISWGEVGGGFSSVSGFGLLFSVREGIGDFMVDLARKILKVPSESSFVDLVGGTSGGELEG